MKPVRIYSQSACGFCRAAKALLGSLKIPFEEIDVTDDALVRHELYARTGRRTVPQIFFGEDHVGGFSDLKRVIESGSLRDRLGLLARAG